MSREKQELYMKEDYDRDLYYADYVSRVAAVLMGLYLEVNRIHEKVFKKPYDEKRPASEAVDSLLMGVRPSYCKFLRKHMKDKVITPELWPTCETGDAEATRACRNWEGAR